MDEPATPTANDKCLACHLVFPRDGDKGEYAQHLLQHSAYIQNKDLKGPDTPFTCEKHQLGFTDKKTHDEHVKKFDKGMQTPKPLTLPSDDPKDESTRKPILSPRSQDKCLACHERFALKAGDDATDYHLHLAAHANYVVGQDAKGKKHKFTCKKHLLSFKNKGQLSRHVAFWAKEEADRIAEKDIASKSTTPSGFRPSEQGFSSPTQDKCLACHEPFPADKDEVEYAKHLGAHSDYVVGKDVEGNAVEYSCHQHLVGFTNKSEFDQHVKLRSCQSSSSSSSSSGPLLDPTADAKSDKH